MPIGKVVSGKLVELDDGEYGIEIEQELFDEYRICSNKANEKWYISESKRDSRPFGDTQADNIKNIKVSIDPVNFSKENYETLIDFYEKDCLLDTECFMRKSVIPNPEIILTLVTGTIAIMTGKKVTEKITEQVADDIVKIYKLIKRIVLETVKRCKQGNRPVTYIIRENNSYLLELLVVTDKPDILFEAVQEEKMHQIEIKLRNF